MSIVHITIEKKDTLHVHIVHMHAQLNKISWDGCSTDVQSLILNQQIIHINRSLTSIDQKTLMILPPQLPHPNII